MTNEIDIKDFLPTRSEIKPAIGKDIASNIVLTDSVMLAAAGVKFMVLVNTGKRGCTQYSTAKVAKPAANSARLPLLYSALPRDK
ncbi:hypothetical protein D3C73_1247270 [compost metagenome]